jgi:3-methyladenine DNA glycosylase/8-oxoguanine DNA glycosylase
MPLESEPDAVGVVEVDAAYRLGATMRGVSQTQGDPSIRVEGTTVWRATRSPLGPVTIRYEHTKGSEHVTTHAWGPGAEWAVQYAADCLGLADDPTTFTTSLDWLSVAHRKHLGVRVTKTRNVFETLVGSVIGQRVTGREAAMTWRGLLTHVGECAPGPGDALGLRILGPASSLADLNYERYHRFGLEKKRADTIRHIAQHQTKIDQLADRPLPDALNALATLRGIGPWTIAETSVRALGNTDAVSVGDFHLKNLIAINLAGVARGTDQEMLELLEQFRPHRARAVRLIQLEGKKPVRFGPRYNPLPLAQM